LFPYSHMIDHWFAKTRHKLSWRSSSRSLILESRRRKVVTNYTGHAPSGHNFLWTVRTSKGWELAQCTPTDVILLVSTRFCAINVSGRFSAACLSPTIRTVRQSDLCDPGDNVLIMTAHKYKAIVPALPIELTWRASQRTHQFNKQGTVPSWIQLLESQRYCSSRLSETKFHTQRTENFIKRSIHSWMSVFIKGLSLIYLTCWIMKDDYKKWMAKCVNHPCSIKAKLSLCLIKWALHHEDKWGSGGTTPPFLISALHHVPAALITEKCPLYPLDRRLGGPQSWSARCGAEKNLLCLPGIKPRPFSPYHIAIPTQCSGMC
jgi:hypothetical protein